MVKSVITEKIRKVFGFGKTNFGLTVLFFLSLFLVIRESAIPFIWDSKIITVLFQKSEMSGASELILGISFSIIAAVIFYYIVNYTNEWNRKNAIYRSAKPFFDSLHCYCEHIVLMVNFAKENQNVKDYSDIAFLPFKEYYYKRSVNGTISGKSTFYLAEDCEQYSRLIMECCEKIFNVADVSFLDGYFIEAISTVFADPCIGKNLAYCQRGKPCGLETAIVKLLSLKCVLEQKYNYPIAVYEPLHDDEIKKYQILKEENFAKLRLLPNGMSRLNIDGYEIRK